jgi:hypothetical protein
MKKSVGEHVRDLRNTRNVLIGLLIGSLTSAAVMLAIWLIAYGLVALVPTLSGLVLAILAIAAGIFILLDR